MSVPLAAQAEGVVPSAPARLHGTGDLERERGTGRRNSAPRPATAQTVLLPLTIIEIYS